MTDGRTTAADIAKQKKENDRIVAAFFANPVGKQVVAILEKTYAGQDVKTNDPHETYFRLGQRDVVLELKRLIGD